MSYMSYGVSGYHDQSVGEELISRGTFYSTIRNISDMDTLANFIREHVKAVPKYVDALIETMNKIADIDGIHYNMIVDLAHAGNDIFCKCFPTALGLDCADNNHSDQYGNDQIEVDELGINAYMRLIKTYAVKISGRNLPYKGLGEADKYSRIRNNEVPKDSPIGKVVTNSVMAFLLIMSDANAIDSYCDKDPSMKEAVIRLLFDSNNLHYDVDVETCVCMTAKYIGSFRDLISKSINLTYDRRHEYIKEILAQYPEDNQDIQNCLRDIIDRIICELKDIFSYSDVYMGGPSLTRCMLDRYYYDLSKAKADILGGKYFGEDAYLIYREPLHIYGQTRNQERWINQEVVDRSVARLMAFVKTISENYEVDSKLVKLFVSRGLHDGLDNSRKDQIDSRVLTLFDKAVEKDISNDEDCQKFIKENLWMFMNEVNRKLIDDEEDQYLTEIDNEVATESRATRRMKASIRRDKAVNKIYGAYKDYKDRETQLDNTLTGLVREMKKLAIGDTRTEIIEGKHPTVLGVAKKAIGAMAICSALGPVKAGLAFIVRHFVRKNVSKEERLDILNSLDSEIEICEEKIEDARHAGHRKEKIKLMRIKAELENARARIRLGMGTMYNATQTVKDALRERRGSK